MKREFVGGLTCIVFILGIEGTSGQSVPKPTSDAEANKMAGDAFLYFNKTKPGVVTLPDGLQFKIMVEGTGPKPTVFG